MQILVDHVAVFDGTNIERSGMCNKRSLTFLLNPL